MMDRQDPPSATYSESPDTAEQARLLQAAMADIATTQDAHAAVITVLRRLCQETGWVLGQVWILNQDGTALERDAVWVDGPDDRLQEFVASNGHAAFPLGKGFLSRIWSSMQPVWVVEIEQDKDFLRSSEARAAGFISALGVPVVAENQVIAVLELFSRERRQEDARLRDLIRMVAGQLRWAIRQKRTHDALVDSAELLKSQNQVLQGIARGEPLQQTLDLLLRMIESQSNGMLCSILLLDPDGIHVRHISAPSLPESFIHAIDGEPIGPSAGSCGTAAFRREQVIVSDIETDPLWEHYREFALSYGLRACWSTPIFDGQRRVLGTFALYFRTPCSPTKRHQRLIEMATQTAAIAIVRHRETEALRVSEERLRLAISGGNVGVWEWDVATDRLILGEELKDVFSWIPDFENLTRERFVEIFYPEDRERVRLAWEQSLAARSNVDIEFRYVRPSGSVRWIVVKGRGEYGPAGEPKRMIGIGLDTTEYNRAAEQVLKGRTELQSVLDNSPGLIFMKDEAGRYLFVNRRWKEVHSSDAVGKTDFELFPEEIARQFAENDSAVMASGETREFEELVPFPDGLHSFNSVKVALKDFNGKIYALCGIATDITERKAREESLRQVNRALRVLSHCNSAVVHATEEQALLNEVCRIAVGPAGYLLAWVGSAEYDESRTARPIAFAGPAAGFLDRIHVSWADNEYGRGSIGPAIRTGKPVVMHNILEQSNFLVWRDALASRNLKSVLAVPLREGDHIWGALAIYAAEPHAFDSSEVELLIQLGEDLAHGIASLRARKARDEAMEELMRARLELEERVRLRTAELEEAKDAAESADRLKSAFLATMSHELRTPLNSIIGFTGIVTQELAGPLNDEQKKQLGMVQNSARHLLALINDVLDISKIEAGQLELQFAPFSIAEAIRKVVTIVSPLAEKKGIKLHTECSSDIGDIVSDQRRTEQVLLNLLGNAVKFTDYGGVNVWCVRDGECVVISVQDTGVGIDPRQQQAIFEPFRQADTGLARKHEGTGLGLSICKRIVERLGGCISVESAPSRGSTFTVRLPLEGDASA